jgi:hypothetical protein
VRLSLIGRIIQELGGDRFFPLKSPEGRLKPQLIYALYKDADVMTQDFAKDFIDLSDRGLSPDRTPELALNHIEGCLDIRPLVVVLHKGFLVEVVEVKHSTPQPVKLVVAVLLPCGVGLEGDVGRSAHSLNCVEIALDGIGFVGGYLDTSRGCLSQPQ